MSQKPVVFYNRYLIEPVVGKSAHLEGVVNHPAGLRGDYVITSTVLAFNPETDEIETRNTQYVRA